MKNIFAVIIAILALGALYTIINDQTSLFAKENKSGDAVQVTNDVDSIELLLESGETEIIPADGNEVKVEIDGKGKLTLKEKGNTIEVEVKHKWYQWIAFNRKSDITVYIPKDYDRNMNIELGSGEVIFTGGSTSKPMKLDTFTVRMGSGDIELANFDTEVFDHKGSSGDLTIENLSTKNGKVDLSSGDVEISNYEGPLSGDVSSGDVTVMMKSLTGDIDFDVSSGEVNLDLPDDASFTLDGRASSGDVSSNFPLKNRKEEDGDLSGTAGNGKYQVKASVSSGSVDIY
ncbi:LiaG family protein [Rossellomorea sp. NS-SX7]|uniref:LiaG family protein n=1 Tax=Rossellomorea sp. NS-SX7 TaxID=3463856 RepID=UPI004057E065